MQSVMGSNLHSTHSDGGLKLSRGTQSKGYEKEAQGVLFPLLLSMAEAPAGQQGYETATPRKTEEVRAFRPDGSKMKSRNSNYWRHPCAFYKTLCVQNTALL